MESQCGFQAERSNVDIFFSLGQLEAKCREYHMPLYVAFIYLTKAFDLVYSDGPFKDTQNIFCPPTLPTVVESFLWSAVAQR